MTFGFNIQTVVESWCIVKLITTFDFHPPILPLLELADGIKKQW